jgi:uncharacterized protein (DUF305 family)
VQRFVWLALKLAAKWQKWGGLNMKKLISSFAIILSLTIPTIAVAHDHDSDRHEARYDIQFLDTMIEHHRQGIEMFKLAVQKSHSKKVKSKAQTMLDEQQKDIPKLQSLRNKIQSNAQESVNMDLPGMENMDMNELSSKSGKDFDEEFLKMTIKHHEGAIKMSEDALNKAQNKDVRNKAKMTIDKQTKEIAELKKMLEKVK